MDVISGSTVIPGRVESFRTEPRVSHPVHDLSAPRGIDRQRIAGLEDTLLVAETVAGNAAAFDELVLRYRDKVVRLVASVVGFRVDVEDIVQDIFVKVYLSLARFRGEASFSTYLYTTAVNRCRDELRRGKLRRFFSFDDWFSGDASMHPHSENDQQVDADERRDAVRAAMKRLPTDTQMLLYLREIEELSYKELADVFKVEMGTIKSRLARARDRLRDELLPYMRDGAMPGEAC
jgi:RNA polymerase sigma-70 factor, ECF subfamily